MKVVGLIFIVLSAGSVGFRIGVILKNRCHYLMELIKMLQILENEISFGGTPLPQAFALVAQTAEGEVKKIFSHLSVQMENCRWISPKTAMEGALKGNQETVADSILLELAEKIGKYDLDTQISSIRIAQAQVQQMLNDLEQERKVKSKTYQTLSICAGLAVAILLI